MKDNINISNTSINVSNNQNNNDIEILACEFDIKLKNTIIKFIENSILKYPESIDISNNIHQQCMEKLGGKWDVAVGERNKYFSTHNSKSALAVNAGPYKILIKYFGK